VSREEEIPSVTMTALRIGIDDGLLEGEEWDGALS
jgi:hypothetical protein